MATSTTQTDVGITMTYGDSTNRKYNFQGIDWQGTQEQLDQIKERTQSLSAQLANGTSSVASTFVSDDGAAAVKISALTITTTEKEVLYSAG